jgi:hypothetical protein
VYVNEWHHPDFRRLNAAARVVRLYVTAGPQTTSVGCFRLSTALAVEDLGGTSEEFEELLETVCETFGWAWDPLARVVWIRDWFEANSPASPNVVASWAKLLRNVPACAVRDEAVASITASLKNLTPAYREPWTDLSKSFRRSEVRPEVQPETNQRAGSRGSEIRGEREQAALRAGAVEKTAKTTNGSTLDDRMLKIAHEALKFGDPNGPIDALVDTFHSCKHGSGIETDIKRADVIAVLNVAIAERRSGAVGA